MLESRKEQFKSELILQGFTKKQSEKEVALSINRLVYYAGWADKYQQLFSRVNPVSSVSFIASASIFFVSLDVCIFICLESIK